MAAGIKGIWNELELGSRIGESAALALFREAELPELAHLATLVRNRRSASDQVTYVIDRNINFTNICDRHCSFCAFHCTPGAAGAYVLPLETLREKCRETRRLGGTGVLLQGGVNPELPWSHYLNLSQTIREEGLWLHGFSPVEIRTMSQLNGLSLGRTLEVLREAGLGSLPGGGAEILVDQVRARIAPLKGSSGDWLEVMEEAHKIGMKTTGTMMFGIGESLEDRVEHLRCLRQQQDRALQRANGGYHTAFAAWPFQSGNTVWAGRIPAATHDDYLRTISVSRIYLDNFEHIQSSWVTMGDKTGQLALHFGCDDMGSLMLEENVVSAAGTHFEFNREEIEHLIRNAGYTPRQRDNIYRSL
nr:CofH family radical SAM protein [uncultured Holophaga sp.]